MTMAKIDTSGWKKMMLVNVFDMSNTKSIVQKDIYPDSGDTPYVTASSENNGIMTYISCPDEWIDKGNCIMIGGKTLTFTYQNTDFCSNDSHNIALYLKDERNATRLHYLFLISALRASLSQRYSWGDSISMKRIKDEYFYIPVDSHGYPDWAYMDSFMAEVMKESEACIENLRLADEKKTDVDLSQWKEFEIGKLFEISRPITRSQAKYSDGDIPFVASGNFSNGVVKYCEPKQGEVLDEKNCITVSPLDGSAFYQPDDFLGRGGAGSAILMLRNNHLNESNGLFVATAIRASLTKYTYSDQLNSQTIASENIKLPVDSHGYPDWAYMNSFMEKIMKETEVVLSLLDLVIAPVSAF